MRRRRNPGEAGGCEAAARAYAARGWSPIPIEPRGKRPLVPWLEFQQRIAEGGEIAAWFARRPDANVGIVTGRVSGIVVVDVDARHGGLDSLRELERAHGALPPTVEATTGGGGRHLYFGVDAALHNRVGLRPGIDLRAEGGCVVAPPSIHPSGRRYAWIKGGAPDALAPAALPAWFVAVLRGASPSGHPLGHWRRLIREGVAEGERNSTLASLSGHLLRRGIDADVALELLLAWNRMRCRPPLPDDEVARVVASIARLHEHEAGSGG